MQNCDLTRTFALQISRQPARRFLSNTVLSLFLCGLTCVFALLPAVDANSFNSVQKNVASAISRVSDVHSAVAQQSPDGKTGQFHGLLKNPLSSERAALAKPSRRPNYEVRIGLYRGTRVAYEVINGWAVIEGDIVIGRADELKGSLARPGPTSITFAHNVNLWLKVGSVYNIPYVITQGNANVPTAISQFNTIFAGVVQWIARTTETDYVDFDFNPSDFSGSGFSSVGRVGGAQQLGGSINQTVPTLFHEMGHATGLWHEQQRMDRDTFVSMNFNNTEKVFRINQDKLPENSQDIGYYDYASIMHYFWNNLSKNGEPVITSVPAGIPMGGGDSDSYTRGDIDGIKRLYEAVPSAVTITSNPLGLQVIVDGTTITTPQTFTTWALNSPHTLNVPSPQTLGTGTNTRYFTYGRWGDSTVQSHTITVTPGDGNRVTPTNKPAKTVYTAHFIELFKYNQDVFPAGAGTMMVSPLPQSYPGLMGQYFVAGQAITLEATPNAAFQFYAWFGNGVPSFSANPQTIKWYYGLGVINQAGFVPTSSPVYTFNTNPTLKTWVLIDGNFWVGPVKFSPFYDGPSWDPGNTHSISVDSPEWPIYSQASQTRYLFNNWSDAGAQTHTITLPSGNASYTANFTTQHFARFFTNSFSDCAGTINVSPPPDPEGYYNDGTVLTISQTTTPGWFLTGWRGDLSGTTSPQMLTVDDEVFVEANHNTVAAPMNIVSLSPASATAGSGPLTLTINGTGFTPSFGTAVWINGTFRSDSMFINSTQMTVPLTVADLSVAGAFQVLVQNNLSSACFNYAVARTFFVLNTGPTAVNLVSFNATNYDKGTLLEWRTGFESNNLGFRLYRDEGGKRTAVNSQLVAGSALRANSTLRAGDAYAWWDSGIADCGSRIADCQNAAYWLEDIDLSGASTWHGPFYAQQVGGVPPARSQAALLGKLGSDQSQMDSTRAVETTAAAAFATDAQKLVQLSLASQNAVKIAIKREGWYHISEPELVAAGLSTRGDPRLLQLFVDGREVPILVRGEQDGSFDAADAIEFYGFGLDSPFTDSRVYWLIAGNQAGLRVRQSKGEGAPLSSEAFIHTIERRDRNIYFSALRNGEKENFFGAVIATRPVDQQLTLSHLRQTGSGDAQLEIALQGVTLSGHRVDVDLNGKHVGELIFGGQSQGAAKFSVAQSLLREGPNIARLTALAGEADISLVYYLRISYQHSFTADNDALKLTAAGGRQIAIDGFRSSSIRVFDVTDAGSPEELLGQVKKQPNGYTVTFASPGEGQRELLALTTEQRPESLNLNKPSNLPKGNGSFIIITTNGLTDSLRPLVALRQSQRLSVAVVDIEDIYDEFSFGQKTPYAVRDFLVFANSNWKKKPSYVLLAGDASYDPKNYLGLGAVDLVPTKLIDTDFMETASDDWLADLNGDGVADLAIGRLPMRTAEEAATLVKKIIGYEGSSASEEVLLVADANEGFDFEAASNELSSLIPRNIRVTQVNRGRLDADTAKRILLDAIHRGQLVVNYTGHGSANVWRGDLLTAADAARLNNEHLPVFVMMTCLNGYFQDAAIDSLAESLMKAEHGGAVAVWTSSGVTLPDQQAAMNKELYRLIFSSPPLTLGEVTRRTKLAVSDNDVRRTWILIGDPAMKLR